MQSKIYIADYACALLMKRNESADDVKEKGANLAKQLPISLSNISLNPAANMLLIIDY